MEIQRALEFFKVMADETRLKLVGLLAERERSVGELAEILELKEPTISHHLTRLSGAELVEMRRDGTVHMYRLKADALNEWSREIFGSGRVADVEAESAANAWEAKVLRTYLEDGRLSKIPQTRKKRDVVLRWLVTEFEQDVRYPEAKVNEIIQKYHPDSATLRRELIGARLMDRDAGVYWRLA